jgi:tetratricopeptide (TPR) repeat protein
MLFCRLFLLALLVSAAGSVSVAQPPSSDPISEILETRAKGLPAGFRASPADREMAFVRMFEGQRYLWRLKRLQSRTGRATTADRARKAFVEALGFDPRMAEGYTALAELALAAESPDAEEGFKLASMAVNVDPKNFGGQRILALLATLKSGFNSASADKKTVAAAVEEWKKVVAIDPRNAEGWAFLSVLQAKLGMLPQQIESLQKWIASAPPLETHYFEQFARERLDFENARLKLASALLKADRNIEAIELLGNAIADGGQRNEEATALLLKAASDARGASATAVENSLVRAVNSAPQNTAFVMALARLRAQAGDTRGALYLLYEKAGSLEKAGSRAAAELYLFAGDLRFQQDEYEEAASSFDRALSAVDNADREGIMLILERLIRACTLAGNSEAVVRTIERSRRLLGPGDLYPDRELIAYYRSSGEKAKALQAVRSVRSRNPDDPGFLRLEATLLAETGKVDEAVALVRKPPTPAPGTRIPVDEFSDLLFISYLYTEARRGKEAAAAAEEAFAIARSSERKQLARITLASAQHSAGSAAAAEATLREILKETPDNPIALNNLGYFLAERGERLAEAVEIIRRALEIDPENPSYLDSLGWAYFKQGDLDNAERYLREAARRNTASATIWEHLGDVLTKRGKNSEARDAYQRALKISSDREETLRIKQKLK